MTTSQAFARSRLTPWKRKNTRALIDRASVCAKPQGPIYFRWRDWGPDRVNSEASGEVLEAHSPSRFVFQWSPMGSTPEKPTTIEFDWEMQTQETPPDATFADFAYWLLFDLSQGTYSQVGSGGAP